MCLFYSVRHQALASVLSLMGDEIGYQSIEDIYGVIGVKWRRIVCVQTCMFAVYFKDVCLFL